MPFSFVYVQKSPYVSHNSPLCVTWSTFSAGLPHTSADGSFKVYIFSTINPMFIFWGNYPKKSAKDYTSLLTFHSVIGSLWEQQRKCITFGRRAASMLNFVILQYLSPINETLHSDWNLFLWALQKQSKLCSCKWNISALQVTATGEMKLQDVCVRFGGKLLLLFSNIMAFLFLKTFIWIAHHGSSGLVRLSWWVQIPSRDHWLILIDRGSCPWSAMQCRLYVVR